MAKLPLCWAIARIDTTNLHFLSSDLRKQPKYEVVEPYIPVVSVLKKQLKGKNHFDKIPLLFNYGFFNIPKYFVTNPNFLDQMRKDVKCVHSWIIDPITVKCGQVMLGKYLLSNPKGIAIAKEVEIENLKLQERRQSIYSAKDIDTLKLGTIITLKKYPFDGLPARITVIDRVKQKVIVEILLGTPMVDKPISVSFENIFYSAYENYLDLEMKEESIEAIQTKYKNFDGKNEDTQRD